MLARARRGDAGELGGAQPLELGAGAAGAQRRVDALDPPGAGCHDERLAQLAPGLDLVNDYGWFTILSKPLFWLLDQLHSIIGNWGWSIVALVFLLKAAFYWLNASAYRSMAKMKAVNPRVMELRERYKDKPQQLQRQLLCFLVLLAFLSRPSLSARPFLLLWLRL